MIWFDCLALVGYFLWLLVYLVYFTLWIVCCAGICLAARVACLLLVDISWWCGLIVFILV